MSIFWDSSFWAMGGYGAFIWPAYGASALGLGGAAVLTLWQWRAARRRLVALERDLQAGRQEEKKP